MVVKVLLSSILSPILIFEVFLGFQVFWGEKILPQIVVGKIPLSGQTQIEATEKLEKAVSDLKKEALKIQVVDQEFEIPLKELGLEFEIERTVNSAYSVGHTTNLFTNFSQTIKLINLPVNLKIDFILNEPELDEFLQNIAKKFDTEITESKLEVKNGKIEFTPGIEGQKIDQGGIKKQIFENFSNLEIRPVSTQVLLVKPEIPEELGSKAVVAGGKFVGKKIILKAKGENFEITTNEILKLVSPISNDAFDLVPNLEKINKFVENELNPKISRPAVDAKFQFDGLRVVAFQPSVDGVTLDRQKGAQLIFEAFVALESSPQVNLPVTVTSAKIKTVDVNNLGIKELVGRGVSNFSGSTAERIHNIKLATSRINGALVAPGDIFSFNSTVGEISTATGFTSAYIISKGRTILGEGGGVCQVSTTAFRAAAYAGLEITKRTAHAYRVRYYEQSGHPVGLDATIFIPSVDFQFRNDTQNHILIQAYTKSLELYFDFYGAKDGRVVELSKPTVVNVRPPPGPLYEEDPSIPAGTTKQVDFQATGATVTVTRVVKKAGLVLYSDKFVSNYKPWQAIFKVGTKQS